MTWTLDNGTIVLQNFVKKDEDCTADKLKYWGTDYLDIVWNTTGHHKNIIFEPANSQK